MRRLLLPIACAALVACGDDEPQPRAPSLADYAMPLPRAIGPLDGVSLDDAHFSIEARDVRYAHDGTHASVDRVVTTLGTRGTSSADLFGVVAQRDGADGVQEWRVASDALRLRELRLLGDARSGELLPARLVVDLRGRPRTVGTIAARAATDAAGTLRGSADVALGGSAFALTGALAPSGRWNATVRLDPVRLADVHAFVSAVPAHGSARGTLVLAGGAGSALRARTDGVVVSTGQSTVRLSGAVAREAGWTLDDVRLALEPVHPDDWRAWLGSDPPVDAPLTGLLLADGSGRDGIAVDGWVLADDGSARLAADVDGTLWLDPQPRLDLAIRSRELRLAERGPLDLDVRFSGDADSLAIVGTARLTPADSLDAPHPLLADLPESVAARLASAALSVDLVVQREGDSRRGSGSALLVDATGRTWLSVVGSAPLGGDGPLDVRVHADSLPLALVPVPATIENLEGYARVRAHATGTLEAPALVADAELRGVRFDVPEFGTGVDSMRTHVRLAGSRIELIDVQAFRAEGSLVLTGNVDLGAPLDLRDPGAALDGATLDVSALLDTMTVVDMDSARAVLAGDATITGPLRRPHVAGTIAVVDGFVFEGKLSPNPPLDPEDPPYADLVRDAPWPTGRLSAAAAREAAQDSAEGPSAPPLTADLTATVNPGFRIIDEDSDLGALGGIRLVIDERGTLALGDARIVDGFYAYYGELFQLAGGAFAVDGGTTRLAMSGELRNADRPLGLSQGGHYGLDRRDPPIGIFGYSTPATVLELLRRRTALPATQAELAALLLFDVPLQAIDTWDNELMWRGDEPDDLLGQRSAVQGAGLAWSWVADELYDYVPLDQGYLRAGTIRIGSRYPGWIMLGTHLEAGVHVGPRLTARAQHVVGGETWPGVGLRYALREQSLDPAVRHLELFNEPRFSTTLGTAGRREDVEVRRRTGVRLRWFWNY